MSEPIIQLTGADGYPILVNVRHVAFVAPAMAQGNNGAKQIAVGINGITMINGTQVFVRAPLEELYRLLKGGVAVLRDEA